MNSATVCHLRMDALRHKTMPLITSSLVVLLTIITQMSQSGRVVVNGLNITHALASPTNISSLPIVATASYALPLASIQNQYSNATKLTLQELQTLLKSKSTKFNDSFRQLLTSSKKDFNSMFVTTYGLHYEQNSQIFTDMYEDLERYYNIGDINLDQSMDHFFQLLYRKLFQVFNNQYNFNEEFQGCISQQLEKLQPFGDYAVNFISNIKKTFIATRTFLKALNVGTDIISNMIDLGQSMQCQTFIQTKLQSAPLPAVSQGGIGIAIPVNRPPCLRFCEQVLERSCFKHNQDLDREWNNYIDSLVKLANRLRTSLNIESVVDPIDVRISEAIMNFQENGDYLKQQVFQACGLPNASPYHGASHPTQIGGAIASQSIQRVPLHTRIAQSTATRRYKRDYGIPMTQMRTRTNNRNRASFPTSVATTLSTAKPFMSSPSLIPSTNNHYNTPGVGTITPKNSQQSSMLLQSSSSSQAPTTTTTTNTNNEEQKILNLIAEIRQQMNKTIGFWYRLPNSVCLNKQILGGYSTKQISVQPNCYSSQLSELENSQIGSLSRYLKTNVNIVANEAKHSSTVQQQVDLLRSTIDKMNLALEGKDVVWIDTNSPAVSTSVSISTTTLPPQLQSTTSIVNEEEDENSLPWCPTNMIAVNDGDSTQSENSDDQSTTEDQNTNNNGHENGEEFGSGDGSNSDSDDESASEDDSSEEDEEETDSESSSGSQDDNNNAGDSVLLEAGTRTDMSLSEEQQSTSPNRGWHNGKPCRIQNSDAQTTPSPTLSTIQPDNDVTKPDISEFSDLPPPINTVDGNSIELRTQPERSVGSSASVCCFTTVILSIYMPLLVTLLLTMNNRLLV